MAGSGSGSLSARPVSGSTLNPTEYSDLIRAARTAALAVDVPVAAALRSAVLAYATRLEAMILSASRSGHWTRAYQAEIVNQARELAGLMQVAIEDATATGIQVSATALADMVDSATARFLADNAPPFYTPPPNLRAASAYAARLTRDSETVAGAFRTIGRHVDNAAGQVDYILTRGIMERADPLALARRMRGYMTGSEQFGSHVVVIRDKAGKVTARKIDLRKLPPELRDAGRRVAYNAERVAITEMHNAAHEATVQAMQTAPMVEAVTWTLSRDRGRTNVPDECDVLAKADYYGLGPGVYPVGSVPAKPHPFDRCYTIPVIRDPDEWSDPKPDGELKQSADSDVLGARGTDARQKLATENARAALVPTE